MLYQANNLFLHKTTINLKINNLKLERYIGFNYQ
nr:MAG TPA: hypothetical protein [Caudoviricetes sp.]